MSDLNSRIICQGCSSMSHGCSSCSLLVLGRSTMKNVRVADAATTLSPGGWWGRV